MSLSKEHIDVMNEFKAQHGYYPSLEQIRRELERREQWEPGGETEQPRPWLNLRKCRRHWK
jgi:hypothetical protein